MDTSDVEIKFNDAGECNHCSEYLKKRINFSYQGEKSDSKMQNLITEIKEAGKGKAYDCIVGLSGGIDSSYVAYVCKNNGLRILAVHMDNGWNSDEAVLNIKSITEKLNIDYESYVLDWENFKEIQLAFLKASVPEAETPSDIALLAAVHIAADKYNVKYIISGGNFATEGILPKYWHYDAKDKKYFNSILKEFGTRREFGFPFFDFVQEMYYKLIKKISIIYLLNYLPYSKSEIIKTLEFSLGWKYYGGKHYESVYTRFIQSYYLYEKFGIDYRRATFSTQICTGEMSRKQALSELEKLPYNKQSIQVDVDYVCKKLGISTEEFSEIMKTPKKWYSDYPNDERKLNFIYNTYRKMFKKEKLGNF